MTGMGANVRLLARQVGHELVGLSRSPIVLFLSVAFPLAFFALVAAVVGNAVIDERAGIRVAQFLAPAFASFGVVMSGFSFLAVGFSEARATGVLKRLRGTPLPPWALLGGRIGAALVLGLVATGLIVGVGVAAYDVQVIGRTLPAVVVTLVLASVSFSALGFAIAALAPSPQAANAITNGIVIPIAFVSDIFLVGGNLPDWLAAIGWFFPLKHLVNALGDAFNPFLDGSGFAFDHLAVILVWGLAGALAAVWRLRGEADRGTGPARARGRGSRPADAAPRNSARPATLGLLRDQVAHANATLWRDPGSVFFAVAFPVLLAILIPTINGGADVRFDDGRSLVAVFAGTMAIYGTGVTCYVNMPEALSEARERGVLKRTRSTPVPPWCLLSGRVIGAIWVSLLTLGAVWAAMAAVFRTGVPRAWPGAVLVLVVAAVCFATLGLALVALFRATQSVVGIGLGTLLPLSFISDVFLIGVELPAILDRLSWVFPLRHATRAMTLVGAPPEGEAAQLAVGHLGVLLAWTALAAAVVAWRFTWENREPRRRRATAEVG